MFGTIGVQEMVVIFIVALVLFGPKKLPELGRTIGKAITEFRRASSDLKASFEREMHNLERETELAKTKAEIQSALPTSSSDYEYPYNDYGESYDYTASNPSTVSASEVPGAEHIGESQGNVEATPEQAEAAAPVVEGTVPRTESAPQHT
jgi:TatA/E family protein of Tat protein translocase